jgi:hypothetical protein
MVNESVSVNQIQHTSNVESGGMTTVSYIEIIEVNFPIITKSVTRIGNITSIVLGFTLTSNLSFCPHCSADAMT